MLHDIDFSEASLVEAYKGRTVELAEARAEATAALDAVADLTTELVVVKGERNEARDWVRRLTSTERVLTCAFCGEAYPPGSPDHGAEVLTAHVHVCAKHPMRETEAALVAAMLNVTRLTERVDVAEAELAEVRAIVGKRALPVIAAPVGKDGLAAAKGSTT